jgi:hypothetical protein
MWPANQPLERRDKLRPIRMPGNSQGLSESNRINVNPKAITRILFIVAGTIILIGSILQVLFYNTNLDHYLLYLDNLFNVDEELNIPSFYSTILLLTASLLLMVISFLQLKEKEKYRWHWLILTFGFLFLATDETITIHEHLNKPFKAILGNGSSGLLTFAWVVPGMIIVVALGITFWKFLFQLPEKTKNAFILAGAFYIGGAIGVEMLGANYAEKHGLVNLTYATFTIVEETCEMLGIILFIRALLIYIQNRFHSITFNLK